MILDRFKKFGLRVPLISSIVSGFLAKRGVLIRTSKLNEFLDEALVVKLKEKLDFGIEVRVGLVKDGEHNFDGFVHRRHDYPKYERFLKNNSIAYDFFDPKLSTWIKDVNNFDIIVWRVESDLHKQNVSKRQIYFLERVMGKIVYPSFHEVWFYEEKINTHFLFNQLGLPEIPTFYSSSYIECLEYIKNCDYPIVSKINTGSASYGVDVLKSRRSAKAFVNSVFSLTGRKTYWPFQRQKDYVFFQEFISDAKFDLRVIVIGNFLFGYYRYPKAGDFRASGSGIVEKKEIPHDVLELAYHVKEAYEAVSLATDFLFSTSEQKYYIIESSIFIGVDSCEQLMVNGVSGVYERTGENCYEFRKGRYWIQELALQQFFLKIQNSQTVSE